MLDKTKELLKEARTKLVAAVKDKEAAAVYAIDLLEKKVQAEESIAIRSAYRIESAEDLKKIETRIKKEIVEVTDSEGKKVFSNDTLRKAEFDKRAEVDQEMRYLAGKLERDRDLDFEDDRYVSVINQLLRLV